MRVSLRTVGSFTLVDIHTAHLDDCTVVILRRTLNDLYKYKNTNIILNLGYVHSFENGLLPTVITMQKKLKKSGRYLSIYGLNQDILAIFYIIRLDEFINLYTSEHDALTFQNILTKRRLRVIKGNKI